MDAVRGVFVRPAARAYVLSLQRLPFSSELSISATTTTEDPQCACICFQLCSSQRFARRKRATSFAGQAVTKVLQSSKYTILTPSDKNIGASCNFHDIYSEMHKFCLQCKPQRILLLKPEHHSFLTSISVMLPRIVPVLKTNNPTCCPEPWYQTKYLGGDTYDCPPFGNCHATPGIFYGSYLIFLL